MSKGSDKRPIGIIMIILGLIFTGFTFFTLDLIVLPIIFLLIGIPLLYSGLSTEGRGIFLIIFGISISLGLTLLFFITGLNKASLIALLSINIIFWTFLFIIPGILTLQRKWIKTMAMYLYASMLITILCVFIFTASVALVDQERFVDIYSQYFLAALGGGFLASLIILALIYAEFD